MLDKDLTLQDVARYPRPGMSIPRQIAFTPDSRQVAYLLSTAGTLIQDLWTYEIKSGIRRQLTQAAERETAPEATRSLGDQLRRERARLRESGITSYQFVQDGGTDRHTLLVPINGAIYVAHGQDSLVKLEGTEGAVDARLSPHGALVAFVREDELWVMVADGSASPRRLTAGAGNGVTNALAEYIAAEEMGRQAGYWWSPDSTRLAYVRADSSHIPRFPIVHQGLETISVEEHRYPFAGAQNATVRLGVVPAGGTVNEVAWMDLGPEEDFYLARVAWRPDGVLTALIQSRDQRTLRLLAFDDQSGVASTIIEEHGEPWLNLNDDTRFLASGEIIWSSEKSGFRHLYLHDRDGRAIAALTEGPWMVTGQVTVDEDRRVVYFQGTRDGPRERHLYAVPLDGGPLQRMTEGAGWHEVVISPDHRYFVDTWSSAEQAPRVSLRRLAAGAEEATLFANSETTVAALGLCVPELTSFLTPDGVLLYAAVYATAATRTAGESRPLLVSVYGGPHAQMVTNNWALTVDMRAQYLAQQGFVVLKVDNRGSAARGIAFEAPLAGRMGHIEIDDQVEGVRFLANRRYIDSNRVGIYGWSYGGYMTLRALLRASDVFRAGVAGAPVTFWEGYDSHYTERYMGMPDANAGGYHASSVLPHVGTLGGQLLLMHGLVDENVHARHTMRLISALTAAGATFDLLLFPEERHMPRDAKDLEYMEQRLVEYLRRHLTLP